MFYGFETRQEAEAAFGPISGPLKRTALRCASKPGCTGSIDGITFMYSDGTTDQGCERTKVTALFGESTASWME